MLYYGGIVHCWFSLTFGGCHGHRNISAGWYLRWFRVEQNTKTEQRHHLPCRYRHWNGTALHISSNGQQWQFAHTAANLPLLGSGRQQVHECFFLASNVCSCRLRNAVRSIQTSVKIAATNARLTRRAFFHSKLTFISIFLPLSTTH